MKWWQFRKRHTDLERELQSDLDLEEEEQRKTACHRKKPVTRRGAPSATLHSFANRHMKPGAGRR